MVSRQDYEPPAQTGAAPPGAPPPEHRLQLLPAAVLHHSVVESDSEAARATRLSVMESGSETVSPFLELRAVLYFHADCPQHNAGQHETVRRGLAPGL